MYNKKTNAIFKLSWNIYNLLNEEHFNIYDVNKVLNGEMSIDLVRNNLNQNLLLFACKHNITDMASMLIEMLKSYHKPHEVISIINSPDICNITPIHWAAYNCNLYLVYVLTLNGAILNSRNNFLSTPLHQACFNGNRAIIDFFVRTSTSPNLQDCYGKTPLHIACITQNIVAVESLLKIAATDLNIPDNSLLTPLHLACINNNYSIVKLLLNRGANVNVLDKELSTPLHFACKNGNINITIAIVKRFILTKRTASLSSLKKLISSYVNRNDIHNSTSLHYAVASGNYELCKILVDYGANLYAKDMYNTTPLDIAKSLNYKEIFDLLSNSISTIPIQPKINPSTIPAIFVSQSDSLQKHSKGKESL